MLRQLGFESEVIVDLAIERQDGPALRACKGLIRARIEIQDSESRMGERDVGGPIDAAALAATMGDRRHHPLAELVVLYVSKAMSLVDKSQDPAHPQSPSASYRGSFTDNIQFGRPRCGPRISSRALHAPTALGRPRLPAGWREESTLR